MQRGVRGSGIPVDPERVRQARLAAGLTLAQVAGKELSRAFIHQVEHGIARPSQHVLGLIARRTGKPVGYFLASSGRAPTSRDVAEELSAAAAKVRRFVAITKLDPSQVQALRLVEVTLRQGAAVAKSIRK